MNYQVLNKSFIVFASSLFFIFFSLIENAKSETSTKKMVASGMKMSVPVITYSTPDSNFSKLLLWHPMTYDESVVSYNKSEGKPCFEFDVAYTYDGKQIAFEFDYEGGGSSQSNTCVREIYKITSEPANTINYIVGIDVNGLVHLKDYWGSRGKFSFVVVTNNETKKLCIKQASDSGVVTACYDFQKAQSKLGGIVKTRLNAIRLREEAKGNIVATTTPVDVDTSVTDTMGPKIDVPGKLVAKNDQIILTGKVTDESTIASVKIDDTPLSLNEDGDFEIALYVPLDGLKVSIEAIDKFTNKTSRTILIARQQDTSSEQLVKMASLNPTKINAKENPNAIALIIGITNYKNIPISIYADKDAKIFADYAYRSLGVPRNKIKLLVNDVASFIEIKKTLKRWIKNEINENKTDVYVFFAGHGLVSNNQKDLYLIPFDGELTLLEDTAFKRSELFSLIEENKPASITAFLDTCYSGLTRNNKMLIADARPVIIVADKTILSSNVTLLSAASNNELASGLEEAQHGLFSYYLMKGLEGYSDLDQNKIITAGELHSYLINKVKKKASKLGRDQTPQISGDLNRVLVRLN